MRWKTIHRFCLIFSLCLLLATPVQVWGATAGTLDIWVAHDNDDAEEDDTGGAQDGTMSLTSTDLELIDENATNKEQIIGLRFLSVTIPKGSTITNAYIEFTVDETSSGTLDLTIKGEKSVNASRFSSTDDDISDRIPSATTASVTWGSIPDWDTVGDKHQSPDLTTIAQEIIDQSGWASGRPMVFIITGTDNNKRVAESYDGADDHGDLTLAPKLHIEYTADVVEVYPTNSKDDAEEQSTNWAYYTSTDLELITDGSTDQTAGIRFPNVTVPQGALITRAYLTFAVDETTSGDTSLTIKGEAADNAAQFAQEYYNITNRTTTSASVAWNDIPYWDTALAKKDSPDISTVIQEIVGRDGWSSGNALAIIISGSGSRTVESYDGASGHGDLTLAPKLYIEYSTDPVPYISADSTELGASCYEGNDATATDFTITNTGSASMSYTATDDGSWVSLSSGSGTLAAGESATITVTYSTSALAVGTHEATITITDSNAPNSPFEIDVSVVILALPTGTGCGNVPVYAENLVSPAILVLLDVSSSMTSMMDISSATDFPQTPELKTIVQEIVDRGAWVSGNAMAFIITGSGHRTAKSYDGSSGDAPLLHVEYTGGTAGGTDYRVSQSTDDAEESSTGTAGYTSSDLELVDDGSDQTVGIRFQNVAIPQGATITSAYIVFEIDESQSETTSLTIFGEDSDNAPTFSDASNNISNRTTTTASAAWNASTTPALESWTGATQQSRIEIGKDAISDLVEDRSVNWGYGTWSGKTDDGYTSSINYTKIHAGCKDHNDAHQTDLQTEIAATVAHSGTPFMDSLIAARKYFTGAKADEDGNTFTQVTCQPMFLIDVTDGKGYYGSSVTTINTETNNLADESISSVAVGFGIDDATQINEMAKEANERGSASDTDYLFALHTESGGVGQPFLANNKEDLVTAFETLTESIKSNIFYGSAPAATTSADLGDTVLIAKFDASDWSGDLEAVTQAADGDWDNIVWKASEQIPSPRNVFTISPSTGLVVEYTDALLTGDNWLCKDIGDIINSTPVVVGSPPFYYTFDGYETWKASVTRDTMIYVGANDGSLHAFDLTTGEEKWAFVPENLQSKLELATDSTYDMCSDDYCHQYFVNGSPKVADIYDTSATEWKTILVVGEREGGEAYFALDVTSGKAFDATSPDEPSEFLWEFTDTELGETWSEPSIKRVDDGSDTVWAVFFGSGYSTTNQANKESYLYGIVAQDESDLWNDGTSDINRVKIFDETYLSYDNLASDFTVGEEITGATSAATATIVAIDQADGATEGTLQLEDVSGTFVDNETLNGETPHPGEALVNGTITDSLTNDALASPLLVDFTGNNIYDQIYAGNLYGTMYRFSSIGKGENPTVTKLFNFDPALTSPDTNPIRAKADYAYGDGYIWILYGTGRYESQSDKTNMEQQYFFGIQDSSGSTTEYSLSDLVSMQARYVEDVTSGQTYRYIDGTNPSNDSWAVALDNSSSGLVGSERVIEKPLVAGGVVLFTTFIPDPDVCAGNGDAWVFALDVETGQAPDSPVFDINQDGVIDEDDVATDASGNTYNVAGIPVGDGQASNPTLFKDILFINTTGEGLAGIDVSLEANRVQIKSWIQK